MKIYTNIILQNIQFRGEIRKAKKEAAKLEKELYQTNMRHDKEMIKLEEAFEKKYKKEISRNDVIAEDNRRLIAIDRKKDKEIATLRNQLKQYETRNTRSLEYLQGTDYHLENDYRLTIFDMRFMENMYKRLTGGDEE